MYLKLENTLWFSIYVQIFTGVIGLAALFLKTPSETILLKELLVLELIVQVIEGSFYVWLIYHLKDSDITIHRYIDWFFTTPTMLLTLIAYLIYMDDTQKKIKVPRLLDLVYENAETISWVVALNALMLFLGALGELKYLPFYVSTSLGFIPFFLYFKIIYDNYVRTEHGMQIFFLFVTIWSLYGVASFFPYLWKNIGYNILDVFSKNAFGVYLFYLVILSSFS